jgi:hypothetical protein
MVEWFHSHSRGTEWKSTLRGDRIQMPDWGKGGPEGQGNV